MKPTLLFTAVLFAAFAIKAQENPASQTPPPAKPDAGCVTTPAPPKAPPIQFKLPPKIQAMLDKQKADFQRKTGIVLPPPPPPKPKLVCPPAQPPAPVTPKQTAPATPPPGAPATPVPANQ